MTNFKTQRDEFVLEFLHFKFSTFWYQFKTNGIQL